LVRRWAVALLALCLACALGACTETKPGVSTANPVVGICHNLTFSDAIDAASDSSPPVACTSPHTVETFAIGRVAGVLADQSTRPGPEQLRPLTGASCPISALRAFLGAGQRDGVAPLIIHAYFPSEADWASGARDIRCDIAVPGAHDAPASIRFDLSSVMKRPQSAYVRTCYRQAAADSDGWSTTGKQTTCDRPHSTQDINAWVNVPTRTPTQAEIQQRCDPFVQEFLAATANPGGLLGSGVVVKDANGTYTLRCTVGGGSSSGNRTGSIVGR
jgi:hypothetical protein